MATATRQRNTARWETLPASQQPHYENPVLAARVKARLKAQPPVAQPSEIRRLMAKLAKVARGEAFILQAGNCAEMFGTSVQAISNLIKILLQMTMILMNGCELEIVKLIRGAGQFAKPRSSDTDKSGLPSYRGDLVNGLEATEEARRHDPRRLLTGYDEAVRIWAEVKRLTRGGFADLRRIHSWTLSFVRGTKQGQKYTRMYEQVASEIDHALGVMEACGVNIETQATKVAETFISHEGLVLDYESCLVREGYLTSGHLVWIGERTRAFDEAHVEFFRHLRGPVGLKLGPKTTAVEVRAYCRLLNPRNIPGKLVLISRMGADNVDRVLPELMEAAKETGCPVIWVCDPMHGNTIEAPNGYKTRRIKQIKREIKRFFRACAATGTHPGGVHLELTGDDVTECLGGHDDITHADLPRAYETACDPRLNARQSLQIAFYVAKLLRQHRANLTKAA